jgi:hypothetical protein
MKRTINDIYELLKQKRENAINDREKYCMPLGKKQPIKDFAIKCKLEGEIDAYTDVLILIETSKVLENEKV